MPWILATYHFILSTANPAQGTSAATSALIPEKKITAPWNPFSQCDFPDVGMAGMRNSVEKAMPKSCVEPLFLEHPLPCLSLSVSVSVSLRPSLCPSTCLSTLSTLELFCFVWL